MGDFIEGEHCFFKLETQNGSVYWPCAIKKLLPNRIAILEIFGTGKDVKTQLEHVEHGYKLSSTEAIEIARNTIPQKQINERFFEAMKQFKDLETFNDIPLKPEIENFWITETLHYF